MPDPFYELSDKADADLEEIFDYTEQEHGTGQAIRYVSAFQEAFDLLVENPEIGRVRREIRPGLRSVLKDQHAVFYRVLTDRVRIVRVLHGSRDVPLLFSD